MSPEIEPFEVAVIITVLFLAVAVFFSLFFGLLFIQSEYLFGRIFHRPFYVHLYAFPKKPNSLQLSLLRQYAVFYNRLDSKRKVYFEHRLWKFLEHCQFLGRDGFEINEEVKVRIAATYIMLTFGMRAYLPRVFDKVIVYPQVYESSITGNLHKGEFNPAAKAVVFSWEDFLAGDSSASDNVNLGIHEFAHAIHFHGRSSSDISALLFAKNFSRIQLEVQHPPNRERLISSDYFRIYAYTNQFEFLAVLMEHYFESPQEFNAAFPELYKNISKMLNHRHF